MFQIIKLNISIDNKQIQQVNKSKALGTIVDQHLFWKPNTENVCKEYENISYVHCCEV